MKTTPWPHAFGAVSREGVRVVASHVDAGPVGWMQIEDDAVIALPSPVQSLDIDGPQVVWKGQDGPAYQLVRGAPKETLRKIADDAHGQYTPAVRNSIVHNVEEAADRVIRYTVAGVERPFPPGRAGTSQGFRGWRANGDVRFTDEARTQVLGGVTMTLVYTDAHWSVGQEPTSTRILAHDARTDRVFVVGDSFNSSIGPMCAAQADGSCWVATSLPAQFIHSSQFTPYVAPTPVPPPPTVPPTTPVPPVVVTPVPPAPVPKPTPVPTPIPVPVPEVTTMRGYLKLGSYLCVEPGTGHVQIDREHPGAWEEVEIVRLGDGLHFTVQFVESGRYLCVTPSGAIETRDSVGAWETFAGADMPDGLTLLYAYREQRIAQGFTVELKKAA